MNMGKLLFQQWNVHCRNITNCSLCTVLNFKKKNSPWFHHTTPRENCHWHFSVLSSFFMDPFIYKNLTTPVLVYFSPFLRQMNFIPSFCPRRRQGLLCPPASFGSVSERPARPEGERRVGISFLFPWLLPSKVAPGNLSQSLVPLTAASLDSSLGSRNCCFPVPATLGLAS